MALHVSKLADMFANNATSHIQYEPSGILSSQLRSETLASTSCTLELLPVMLRMIALLFDTVSTFFAKLVHPAAWWPVKESACSACSGLLITLLICIRVVGVKASQQL